MRAILLLLAATAPTQAQRYDPAAQRYQEEVRPRPSHTWLSALLDLWLCTISQLLRQQQYQRAQQAQQAQYARAAQQQAQQEALMRAQVLRPARITAVPASALTSAVRRSAR